jgi:AcrR family transcriptional regulator
LKATKVHKNKAAPARRTQRERRETTIKKLVDATIESLLSVGYARTTVKEVVSRAELSHGALFRFFPSMLDLVLAAGAEIAQRQIAEFERRFERARKGEEPIAAALKLLRAACRSPTNAVFYELLLAARTDAALRRALEPQMRRYYAAIHDAALTVPGMDVLDPELLDVLLFSTIHLFDGETLARSVLSLPELEERRLELLIALVRSRSRSRPRPR